MREWESEHGPDGAKVIYRYRDGWTIRNITRLIDVGRESALLCHCTYLKLTRPDGRRLDWLAALGHNHEHVSLVSLRSPSNYPAATFIYDAHQREMQRLDTGDPLFSVDDRVIREFLATRVPQPPDAAQLLHEIAAHDQHGHGRTGPEHTARYLADLNSYHTAREHHPPISLHGRAYE